MPLSRRGFLKSLAATAAGLFVPADVLAEPERRVWPGWSPPTTTQLQTEAIGARLYHALTPHVAGIVVGEVHLPERRDWLEVISTNDIWTGDMLYMGGEYLMVTDVRPGRVEVVRDIFRDYREGR